jgi:hypothetical protein
MWLCVAAARAMAGAVAVQVAVARTVCMRMETTMVVVLRCDRIPHRLFCVWFAAACFITEIPIDPMTGICKCCVLLLSGCRPPQVSSTLGGHVEPPDYNDKNQKEAN